MTVDPPPLRTVTLHDTRTGQVRPIEPADGQRVRIYTCGPTVYGRVHVGNARPFIVFSQLKRFLEHEGYEVELVSNVTDVNDKIYAAAAAAGVRSDVLAEQMTARYYADTDALGLGRPDHEPLASASVGGIIALIESLIEAEHAYAADGDVYFSVRSDPRYGELSHRDVDQLDQGEGVDGAARKRDPLDFALWKAEKPGEDTSWPAPWGAGRPGWHIECSAMAQELLGVDFEIHGGGSDLLFPHHENELAQTRGATGGPLAKLWAHVGMIRLDAEKMSKSLGNTSGLAEAIERHGAATLLAYFAQAHWRQPMEYDEGRLAEAAAFAARIAEAGRRLGGVEDPSPEWSAPLRERYFAALAADFNTPQALAALADWIRAANRQPAQSVGGADLAEMLVILGLSGLMESEAVSVSAAAAGLLEARQQARDDRDFAAADRLRDELRALGWEVRDGPDGPALRPI